jgi:ATP-binding cassette, subfamily C (CFTR/MRP), member 1
MMTMTLPVCVVAIYLVQKIYLRTSRQLRLLDLEAKSAVYSSFLESVSQERKELRKQLTHD